MPIVNFAKRPCFDSKGRNGYVRTTGIEISDLGPNIGNDEDGTIMLHPLNSRGDVSEACRLSIARSALPELIAALQSIQTDLEVDLDSPDEGEPTGRYRVSLERGVNECRDVVVLAPNAREAARIALEGDFNEDLMDDWEQLDPQAPYVTDVVIVDAEEPLTPRAPEYGVVKSPAATPGLADGWHQNITVRGIHD